MIVGVIGGSQSDSRNLEIAYTIGKLIARNNWILVCGGLTGVMEYACKGAYEAGGITVGILPGNDKHSANQYVKIPIATGMGLARNYIIINTADVLIAIDGRYGTLNEISAALNLGKRVVAINSWKLGNAGDIDNSLFFEVKTPEDAIDLIKSNFIRNI